MLHDSLLLIGMLAGGLGLFILALNLITDGLKLAAGHTLKQILATSTQSIGRGIMTGTILTAIIQSSSAVTVATIGFINAGLITLYQSLGIIFGSNIGTTMTGWIVAIIGFKFKVEAFALPLIGLGMLIRFIGKDRRSASIGMALAGFGLFFIGIDVLREAFDGISKAIDLEKFTVTDIYSIPIYLLIGFLITLITQSSSAAIALTLSAVNGGLIGIYAGASMVIGANVGTTSTAVLAVIGATPNAKRVAAAHVTFNMISGLLALGLLPILFFMVNTAGNLLGLDDNPSITLALFHTIFNIMGVLLFWPFSHKLSAFLEKRFISLEELESRPRYLDKNITASPETSINAFALELIRMSDIIRRMAKSALSIESVIGKSIAKDHMIIKSLSADIADYVSHVARDEISRDISNQLSNIVRSEQHLLACADQIITISKNQGNIQPIDDPLLQDKSGQFRSKVISLLEMSDIKAPDFSIEACDKQLEKVQESYENIKSALLEAGADSRAPIPGIIEILDQNSHIRRMARQMIKATRHLNELYIKSDSTREEQKAEDSSHIT